MSQEYFVVKLYTGGYESVFLAFGNKEDVIERLRTELGDCTVTPISKEPTLQLHNLGFKIYFLASNVDRKRKLEELKNEQN